jgi:hypothetical protein
MLMPWPPGPQGGDVLGVHVEGAGADGDAVVAVETAVLVMKTS